MPNKPPDPNSPSASDSPSTLDNTPVTINDVMNTAGVGSLILSYLDNDMDDIRDVALVNHVFYRAAEPYLWKGIWVPYLDSPPEEPDCEEEEDDGGGEQEGEEGGEEEGEGEEEDGEEREEGDEYLARTAPFWEWYGEHLRLHTRSLVVDLKFINPELYEALDRIGYFRRYKVRGRTDHLAKLDVLYFGARKVLAQTKHLVKFTARNVPGMQDLVKSPSQPSFLKDHPDIQELEFSGALRDPVGLYLIRKHKPRRWWMSTILNQASYPLTNLSFPNLRILSLTDLRYGFDGDHGEQLDLVRLVHLLGSAPNLAHLRLSLSNDGGDPELEHPLFGMPGLINGYCRKPSHFLSHLCKEYNRPCFQPLQLQTLWLGSGCNVKRRKDPTSRLRRLVDFDCLEELHVERPVPRDGTACSETAESTCLGERPPEDFIRCRWVQTINVGGLSRLRKVTLTWGQGRLFWELYGHPNPAFHNLTLRKDPSPKYTIRITEECNQWLDMCDIFDGKDYRSLLHSSLNLNGLVLPTDGTSPDESIQFVHSVLVRAPGLKALKIRLSNVSAILKGNLGERSTKRKSYATGTLCMPSRKPHPGRDPLEFWNILSKMTLLRELWLADGLGDWDHMVRRSKRVNEPFPNKDTIHRLVPDIIYLLPNLVYLRILDRAWHVKWTAPGCLDPYLDPAVVKEGYHVCHLYGTRSGKRQYLMWRQKVPQFD
ncbi:uncharacterized protein C8A04DRAFT_31278 [Dichotomopilus funicola]|uniref:Uncharacterized protein n=1 Tax=Dichotomopilus funicola TaxID=1934379 RepID=A0AAN6UZ70_9PEZI|nr:hypothetical protein C8A04DRAFT_31278 [Dichotomopilus funicola]